MFSDIVSSLDDDADVVFIPPALWGEEAERSFPNIEGAGPIRGCWWRCRDLNPGLRGYEPRALTSWATPPLFAWTRLFSFLYYRFWSESQWKLSFQLSAISLRINSVFGHCGLGFWWRLRADRWQLMAIPSTNNPALHASLLWKYFLLFLGDLHLVS